ncbi:MAG: hypothetical protein QFF03_20810 [Pseudomonadota bacterium]|nr:hypothetical protein [Pseudomonadota bacterium]
MMQYGFQRLVMLGSAGYQRAELPLDAAVSLIAPNNTGKTSLINALQFLLIVDKRRMDFGAHDVEKSRRFYFPNNSAFILLEVALPTTGTVVLGCVGKGVSHDYEYFAYKGQLDMEDYRLPNGSVVTQPQLKAHLATRSKLVFSYSSGEFSDAIYGSRKKRQDHEPDFTIFKLEHASLAEAFQRVLTRTLRLDRLRSGEVKDYLLSIFRRDLPDANIDFKAEWDKAFADVNADRAQYQAALAHQAEIAALARDAGERLALRGKLIHNRPLIDSALLAWDRHFADSEARLQEGVAQVERDQRRLRERELELAEQHVLTRQRHQELQATAARHAALAQQFALVAERRTLEARHAEARVALEAQIALVQQASTRSVDAIERERRSAEQERTSLLREQATLTDNLYLRLQPALNGAQLDALNVLLARQVMTLGASQFDIDPQQLPALRAQLDRMIDGGRVALPGIAVSLETLEAQHSQRTPAELELRIAELAQQIAALAEQAEAARALDAARARKQQLEKAVRQLEHEIGLFDELSALILSAPQRAADLAEVTAAIAAISAEQAQAQGAVQALREQEADTLRQLAGLRSAHKDIVQRRDKRGDAASVFSYLADLPHQPWTGAPDFALDQLAGQLEGYGNDCRRLLQLNEQLPHQVAELHACGLTKFSYMGGEETEIDRMIAFAAHLPQEAEALERKARSAVVNVTACLRELRDGLLTFKSRMRDFNRLISRRQLSDLAVFKIEPADELQLVDAIELLIAKAEQVDDGETFSLFNHASVLDDDALNRAKQVLIGEGEARGCLRVEHLFRLEFIVGKAGRATESFTDIDSAASNGTVLMAKLITGLALLHLMQDKRHRVQAVCYLDEASALDQRNQRSLIETADDFGFALIFASPAPLVTARYCVPISSQGGYNHISRQHWQVLEPLGETAP